jgi:epoxyqueuosine reductase QueG
MNELKKILISSGASLVGFADLNPVPETIRGGLPNAVSIAVSLNQAIVAQISNGPTMEYYADYDRANKLLAELGYKAAQFLESKGFEARIVVPTTEGYNRGTNSVPFQHKTAATRAGLGWIGKCALLVTREHGSAIRLVTVLTDGILPAGEPVEVSGCGECISCVEQCPANAPSGREWKVGMEREEFFNASLCRSKAKELSARIGLQKTICGICIAACPWTQHYIENSN